MYRDVRRYRQNKIGFFSSVKQKYLSIYIQSKLNVLMPRARRGTLFTFRLNLILC